MLAAALLLAALPIDAAAETVLGAYIFSRHGDRTAKKTPPANLTDLGYQQVFASGGWYRNRYVASGASNPILGLNSDVVKNSQLSVSSPSDTVLQNSATGFLQGLYPPTNAQLATQRLRNGSTVQAPLNGYQLIPISPVSTGTDSEDDTWLQDATGCAKAKASSNSYFHSDEYVRMSHSTHDFYQDLWPTVNATFSQEDMSYLNAYTIYDLLNVAEIHNDTINSFDTIGNSTSDTFQQLRTLADRHEYGLAYNATDQIRAIAGMQLAAEIVDFLNGTITGKGEEKLGIQFGAYGTFASFFGLSNLTADAPDFYGIVDYASTMAFELYTNADTDAFPTTADDINVRFLFKNGSAGIGDAPQIYPLFGSVSNSWTNFTANMAKFSVGTTEQWCKACGNFTGKCAPYSASSSTSANGATGTQSSGGSISTVVAGVIGAMVTLGVILLVEALVLLLGGFRLVSKKRLAASPATSIHETTKA